MKRTDRAHINERMKTGFVNSGRAAGAGILYDRYDEESGYRPGPNRGGCTLPSERLTPEERANLNGEVKIIRPAKRRAKP